MREPSPPLTMRRAASRLASLALASALLGGCDEKKPSPEARPQAPSAEATATPEPPRPPPDKVPDVSVDAQGVYMGGERADLKAPDGAKKLKDIVARYKLDGKSVTVVALRNARTPDVAATVHALGEAGVSDVALRTQDRSRKDAQLKVLPEGKAGKLPDCTVALMMLKDRTTASWPIRGATATKYPKGMAGPDLSLTLEGVTKQANGCSSTALVFSGDDSVEWGLTFDMVTRVSTAEPPLKITTYVLPHEAPVAGHAVKLGS